MASAIKAKILSINNCHICQDLNSNWSRFWSKNIVFALTIRKKRWGSSMFLFITNMFHIVCLWVLKAKIAFFFFF